MHHIALNGAGANNGHFDNQVIKAPWLHPRQKVHLRPAFDLKHPDTVCFAQHIVHGRVFRWQAGQRVGLMVVHVQKVKGLANAGQHTQRQNIDFEDAKTVNVILVPADDRTILHRGIFNWNQLIQTPFGHDEATNMLAEVAGKADHLVDQREGLAQLSIIGVKTYLAQTVFGNAFTAKAPPKL